MTNTRTATWANLGTTTSDCKDLDSVLKKSGLDFEVVKKNIYTRGVKSQVALPGCKATVIKGTDRVLGIVSDKYKICQNKEAFEFVNYISSEVKYEKAGMTAAGLVYIIASLPEVKILGDSFKPHVIFQNGFNGCTTVKAAISPLRLVCQNQFSLAFKEANSSVSIRHTSTMQSKLVQARDVLRDTADYMQVLNHKAEHYAGVKLTEAQVTKVIDSFFPITEEMTDRSKNSIQRKRTEFINAYSCDDNANFRGTMWGLINAASDYMTHYLARSTEKSAENRFAYVTLSPALEYFMKVLTGVVDA